MSNRVNAVKRLLEDDAGKPEHAPIDKPTGDPARDALQAFVSTVEATGGVEEDNGIYTPVADSEWIDLGDAYVAACRALGREPKVRAYEPE